MTSLVESNPFSLEDISKKLGAKISVYLPDNLSASCQGADFCLVLGSDLTDKLKLRRKFSAGP